MRSSVGILAGFTAALALSQTPERPWLDRKLPPERRVELLLSALTLDEKLSLMHGLPRNPPAPNSLGGAGMVAGIPRVGLPDLQFSDASAGVARGAARSRYATALPSSIAEAAAWDPALSREYGVLIGAELRAHGFNVTLGGGVNLTREPRNGRNFEYHGEDPILAGILVREQMLGTRSQGIVTHIKHYAGNDQETGRHSANVLLSRRALRETELLPFEIALRSGGIDAVMCSYNLVNGDWACENSYLLNDVLKNDWKFPGFVISDWNATHSTTKALQSGLDLEMPSGTFFGAALKAAVESRDVPVARIDDAVRRILRGVVGAGLLDGPRTTQVVNVFAGFDLSQKVAERGIVLLKNARQMLPLDPAKIKTIAVIGGHADVGVLSGGGSAQVDPPGGNAVPQTAAAPEAGFSQAVVYLPSSPLKALREAFPGARVEFDSGTDPQKAAALAKSSAVALVFATQPTREGIDASLELPNRQNELIEAVAAANPNTVIILETGAQIAMPWLERVPAVLEAWYPGIRGAEAIANILVGRVNPSGKLPVTFPKSAADLPHPVVRGTPEVGGPGPKFDLPYPEELKVGYKWFDAEKKEPLFPFGFGLSYTQFAYSALEVTADGDVSFRVTNTGRRSGADVAQVYASLPASAQEPPRRLVAWERVELAPGASQLVKLKIDPLYLSIFDEAKNAWKLEPGNYSLAVGGSSRDARLTAEFKR